MPCHGDTTVGIISSDQSYLGVSNLTHNLNTESLVTAPNNVLVSRFRDGIHFL